MTPQPPLVAAAPPPRNATRAFQHEVRGVLIDQGFTEVYNYSFISEEAARRFRFDPENHVRVANPIASDQALLRASLLPGIYDRAPIPHRQVREDVHRSPADIAALSPQRLAVKVKAPCLVSVGADEPPSPFGFAPPEHDAPAACALKHTPVSALPFSGFLHGTQTSSVALH